MSSFIGIKRRVESDVFPGTYPQSEPVNRHQNEECQQDDAGGPPNPVQALRFHSAAKFAFDKVIVGKVFLI